MINAGKIQDSLYKQALKRGYKYWSPNTYMFSWESDFINITQNDYIYEYEVKISHDDFKADFVKKEKHEVLEHGCRKLTDRERVLVERHKNHPINQMIGEDGLLKMSRPNRFYYICPDNIIRPSEIPKYAGLIYLGKMKVIKDAPVLHDKKVTDKMVFKMLKSYMYRYWELRVKVK